MLEKLFKLQAHNTTIKTEIIFGIITYVILKLFTLKTKDLNPALVILALIFIIKILFL